MDKLNLGCTIFNLRKEKDISQEELAKQLGVSAGAVSKWENGKSMPDIMLLAPLARALNTSLDELFSFHQELSEAEAVNIKQRLIEVFLKEGYDTGEVKCKEYLNEYPNSINMKFIVAGLIQMYSMMKDNASEEFIINKRKEALSLFEEVADSKEPKYAPIALFCIANIYMMLEDYEESEKALKKLPQTSINPMDIYPALLLRQKKNGEAAELCSKMLLHHINQSCLMLSTLARIANTEQKHEKSFCYLDTAYKIQSIFKTGLGSAAHNYSKLCLERGEMKEAAKWFKTYIETILSSGYDYSDNPYFENIELEVKPEGQKIIRKKLLQSLLEEDDFKALEGIFDYETAVKKLKSAVAKM